MKVIVSLSRCVGHARCEAVAKGVYSTDDVEGKVVPVSGMVPRELEALALRGARACPERAITVIGNGESGLLWPPRKFFEENK